eukprot:3182592-Amphidinium_carterae.1
MGEEEASMMIGAMDSEFHALDHMGWTTVMLLDSRCKQMCVCRAAYMGCCYNMGRSYRKRANESQKSVKS